MTDNEMDATLYSFHRDPSTHHDMEAAVQRVLATAIEETPQRRGWQSLSPRWRFGSMFSAAKFVVAGAIVALFGGFLLIAQPFDQQGSSVPGAATDTKAAAPVEFRARVRTDSWDTVLQERRDGSGTVTGRDLRFPFIETSDPRIDGALIRTYAYETYPGLDAEVEGISMRIENEGGAWQQVPTLHEVHFPWDGRPDGYVSKPEDDPDDRKYHTFAGEDGYEGWFFVTNWWHYGDGSQGFDLHGLIIEGDLPRALERWQSAE